MIKFLYIGVCMVWTLVLGQTLHGMKVIAKDNIVKNDLKLVMPMASKIDPKLMMVDHKKRQHDLVRMSNYAFDTRILLLINMLVLGDDGYAKGTSTSDNKSSTSSQQTFTIVVHNETNKALAMLVYTYLAYSKRFFINSAKHLCIKTYDNVSGTILHQLAVDMSAAPVLAALLTLMKASCLDVNAGSAELYRAVQETDEKSAKEFLVGRGNPNGCINLLGETPLTLAKRADLTEHVTLLERAGMFEWPPLLLAIILQGGLPMIDWLPVIKLILEVRALIDVRDKDGCSVLHWALPCKLEFATTLIDAGIDVNAQDFEGNTVLHAAALLGNKALVELLLKQPKIKVRALNKAGLCAQDGVFSWEIMQQLKGFES